MQKTESPKTQTETKHLVDVIAEEKIARRLGYVYEQIPANNCQRCGDCCFNCASVHPIEFLNIFDFLQTLPELTQLRLAKQLVRYEVLNLTTLQNKCPFLEEKNCLVYERRPLQCRLFGLYTKDEYRQLVAKSLYENEKLAMYYARFKRVALPKEVMTYDIEQCENNADEKGNLTVVTEAEREHLHKQIFELGQQTLPTEWQSPDLIRFSYQYSLLFFSEEELEDLKVRAIKEFQSGGKSPTLEKLLASKDLSF